MGPVMAVCELRVLFMECQHSGLKDGLGYWEEPSKEPEPSSVTIWHLMTLDIHKVSTASLYMPQPRVLETQYDYFKKHNHMRMDIGF